MWRQEEVVTLEVWERGWAGKEWASQGAHELKIQASSAVLCTCKAPGQKREVSRALAPGRSHLPVPSPPFPAQTATSCCSLKAVAAQLPQEETLGDGSVYLSC